MINSRTPFRISFAGGGTDLESYDAVLSSQVLNTINDKCIEVVAIADAPAKILWVRQVPSPSGAAEGRREPFCRTKCTRVGR